MHKKDFCQFQTDQNESIILKMMVTFLTDQNNCTQVIVYTVIPCKPISFETGDNN